MLKVIKQMETKNLYSTGYCKIWYITFQEVCKCVKIYSVVYWVWLGHCYASPHTLGERGRRRREETLLTEMFFFLNKCYTNWGPASQEVAEYHLLMRSGEFFFSSFFFLAAFAFSFIKLLLPQTHRLIFFSLHLVFCPTPTTPSAKGEEQGRSCMVLSCQTTTPGRNKNTPSQVFPVRRHQNKS